MYEETQIQEPITTTPPPPPPPPPASSKRTSLPFCHVQLSRPKFVTLVLIFLLTICLIVFTCSQSFLFNTQFLSMETSLAVVKPSTLKTPTNINRSIQRVNQYFNHEVPHYPHTSRRLPQCIIIGVRKAGTRALLQFLDVHPDVIVAGAEIHFFDVEENYSLGIDWYRKRMPFSFPGQVTMEKSPAYFVGESVPERIHKMNESIKLLLIVREPVERTVSDYTQIMMKKKSKNKPFPKFSELVIDPMTKEINRHYPGIRRSIYHRYMERWLQYFNLSQIHIVDGDKFRVDPFSEITKVETFLNLSPRIQPSHFYFNKSKGFYCIKNANIKCLAESKGRQHPDVPVQVLERLREFYKPHNEKFFRLIGRRFDWV